MENKIACIKDGVVENVIVCDDAFAQTLGYDAVVNVTSYVGVMQPGLLYQNGEFTVPPQPEQTQSE
jgi:hypothetical protein